MSIYVKCDFYWADMYHTQINTIANVKVINNCSQKIRVWWHLYYDGCDSRNSMSSGNPINGYDKLQFDMSWQFRSSGVDPSWLGYNNVKWEYVDNPSPNNNTKTNTNTNTNINGNSGSNMTLDDIYATIPSENKDKVLIYNNSGTGRQFELSKDNLNWEKVTLQNECCAYYDYGDGYFRMSTFGYSVVNYRIRKGVIYFIEYKVLPTTQYYDLVKMK